MELGQTLRVRSESLLRPSPLKRKRETFESSVLVVASFNSGVRIKESVRRLVSSQYVKSMATSGVSPPSDSPPCGHNSESNGAGPRRPRQGDLFFFCILPCLVHRVTPALENTDRLRMVEDGWSIGEPSARYSE